MPPSPADAASLPLWLLLWLLSPAAVLALGAAIAGVQTTARADLAWRAARWASGWALGSTLLMPLLLWAGWGGAGYGWRADVTGALLALLVSFIGWVAVRYAQPYLAGESGEPGFVRWLLLTLAAVQVVAATNHALVLVLAWSASSLSLNRLLTFYRQRGAAVLAAHKEFIVARAADLCMLVALAVLGRHFGTLALDQWSALAAASALPWEAQAAVVLLALAAVLKCAQLPVHGWLIQVMEAPTPVSALLHAGIVNLGGFVLIRVAPLVSQVAVAQALLVFAGTLTAIVAALVMTTRISIKVSLAWSTCAQMGFMLMQCGLGVWEMALVHLVAHSLYKAHAFLAAGGVVRRTLVARLAPQAESPPVAALLWGLAAGAVATFAAGRVWGVQLADEPALMTLCAIVSIALVPLLHSGALRLGGAWPLGLALGAFATALVWFGLHALSASLMPAIASLPDGAFWWWSAVGFGLLFAAQVAITAAPRSSAAKRAYPWLYGGLFLDERLSRIVLRWLPPPAPSAALPHTLSTNLPHQP